MKIALPMTGGRLAAHFGHCEQFVVFEVDPRCDCVTTRETYIAPPHEPGLLPAWLKERGVSLVIAGGMGTRAQQLFAQNDVETIVGAPDDDPRLIVNAYLNGSLKPGDNICAH